MRINAHPRLRRLFKLRTILLVVMLSVLFLPLGSIYFLRFYENDLVRKTELELISQSAALAATYRLLINQNHLDPAPYLPVVPTLDLSSNPILPRRPVAQLANTPQHPLIMQAAKQMQSILAATQQVTLSGMRLLDANGVVIAGKNEVGLSLAHIKEVRQALKGEYSSVIRERISDEPPPPIASISRGTKIRIFTAFPIIDEGHVYGVIYLSRTPQNVLKRLYANKKKVFFLSFLMLGLTGVLASFISSRLSRPIRELIEQTQQVTSGELETVDVLRQPGTYELSQLSNSFAEMSKTLHERTTYIDRFASHVSHEFKTPLTSMQGTLELLEEHIDDMPLEQRRRFLNNLQEDTQRLKRLVNRLLEQARADSTQVSSETSNLAQVLEQMESRFSDTSLQLNYQQSELDVSVKVTADSLKIIFNNLFDNSLKHGADAIEITANQENEELILYIQDNGSGISAANRKRIFTPFFTTRREKGGTGLGLGIVESLLKVWNGEIELLESDLESNPKSNPKSGPKPDKGALFKIRLFLEQIQ